MHYKKETLEIAEKERLALTFDDVRLIPAYSEILPDKVNLFSRFSRNVPLKIPLVSAAMDTITEHKMAIEMAKNGGLGIIHKNFSPKEQAYQVARVKHHLNGKIEDPICVMDYNTMQEVLNMKDEKAYTFHSFPVLDSSGKLVGLITRNDFDFCEDTSRQVKDIMTTSLLTSSEETTIEEAYKILLNKKKKILPLIKNDGELTGIYVFSDVKRIVTENSGMYNTDSSGKLLVGAAIGVYDDAFSRLEELVKSDVDVVVIDTAHGHSKGVIETLKKIKNNYPNIDVVAGNIATGDGALALANAGADGVKVGIGPGSICTTRIIAGIGTPQLSAIYRCSKALSNYDIPVCGDGGLKNSGDITIALGGGADSVMMGNMLGGTDECPGDLITFKGRQWKRYRGMGSLNAMREHKGSKDRYQQGERKMRELVPEGIEGLVAYRGKLSDILIQYSGGLKSGMGYVGAKSIKELHRKAKFDRITKSGIEESHPHDILITEEAPNYTRGNMNA
ncbi:MAG: IMP dehydrogenase [Nanobdellota archaeon]